MENVYVTLASSGVYGWLHLMCTLYTSKHDVVVMIPDTEPPPLPTLYDASRVKIIRRPWIRPHASSGRYSHQYNGFMKLHLWNLTKYERIVYFDHMVCVTNEW